MIHKYNYINLFLGLFVTYSFFLNCSDSQKTSNNSTNWIEVDSLLFADSSFVLPYRYSDLFNSANTRFINYAKTVFASGATCVLPYDEQPKVYMLDEWDLIISVREYLHKYMKNFPSNLICVLRIKIAWTGQVREIKLLKYKCDNIEKIDLTTFANRLRATPYRLYGLSVSKDITFHFRLSKQTAN